MARQCRIARLANDWKIIAVQDAYRAFPYVDVIYGCCPSWWRIHGKCEGRGELWTTQNIDDPNKQNEKLAPDAQLGKPLADLFGLNCVAGAHKDTFSTDPGVIHYGSNSGFQAINLALLFGCKEIVLVGFDMRHVAKQAHFFGDHPKPLHQNTDADYRRYVPHFARAAAKLPEDVQILNATPGSALDCFPMVGLDGVLTGVYAAAV